MVVLRYEVTLVIITKICYYKPLKKGFEIMDEFDELMKKDIIILNGYKKEFRELNKSKGKAMLYEWERNNFLLIEYKDKSISHYHEVINWCNPAKINAIVRYLRKNKNVIILFSKPCQGIATLFKVYQYDKLDVQTMYYTKIGYEQIIKKLDDKKIVDIQVTDKDREKAEKDRIKYNKEHGINY